MSITIPNTFANISVSVELSKLDENFTYIGTKLEEISDGTNTGNQNLFSTIAVAGQSNIVADTTSDSLTLIAGSNVTITTDALTDSITISASGGGGGGTSSGTNTGDQNLFSTIAIAGQSNVVADNPTDTLTLVAGTNMAITTATPDTITITAPLTNYVENAYLINYTNLGVLPTSITLDITKRWNIGEFTGSATTHTINAISPTVSTLEPAHFTFVNNGSVTKTIVFNGSILSIAGSTFSQVTLPIGYKIDFDIRRNPLNVGVSYEAKVGDVNYNQSASGLATTWNPSDYFGNPPLTLSNSNTTIEMTTQTGSFRSARAFGPKSTGKYRVALRANTPVIDGSAGSFFPLTVFGLTTAGMSLDNTVGALASSYGLLFKTNNDSTVFGAPSSSGGLGMWRVTNNAVKVPAVSFSQTVPDIVYGMCVDFDANKLWFTRENLTIWGGDPEAGTGEDYVIQDLLYYLGISLLETNTSANAGVFQILNEVQDPYVNTWPSFITWTA